MFQRAINYDYAFGIVGEIRKDGPLRAKPGFLVSADATQNVIGRALTQNTTTGIVSAGGTGTYFGILSNPKNYESYGNTTDGPLGAAAYVPNNTNIQALEMAIVTLQVSNAGANPGDQIHFVQATGALLSVAAGTSPATGNTLVPNAVVSEFHQPNANGLVLVKLTN